MNQIFSIEGMHCEACTKLTAKRIRSIDGVIDAAVDLSTGKASVSVERTIGVDEINTVLDGTGYKAEENE